MKVVSIVGARPQFIKCAPLSRELRKYHYEILVHTGQHYDPDMSDIFFEDLKIPKPNYHLGVGSGSHGQQTGKILSRVESVLMKEQPDLVIVYGDTNSTLAGALAAAKLHIPIAHVEAGMRSFDRLMPEEINRVVTDHISNFHFCPTHTSINNLIKEGVTQGVHLVGDVMVDALKYNKIIAEKKSNIIKKLCLKNHSYLIMTVHRSANTDSQKNMISIISAIGESNKHTIFPVHPRTKKYLINYGLWDSLPSNIHVTAPLGYLDMLKLMSHAEKILTDSGGIQKEAFILGVPCITLRDTTEWVETLVGGWNILVGKDKDQVVHAIRASNPMTQKKNTNFKPGACKSIINILNKNK